MEICVFDMFRVGLGPSSSHTVGPLRAAKAFVDTLMEKNLLEGVSAIQVELMGSLAATGRGHGTDIATILGLLGETPETVDPDTVEARIQKIREEKRICLGGKHWVDFDPGWDIRFEPDHVPEYHTNAMELTALRRDIPL